MFFLFCFLLLHATAVFFIILVQESDNLWWDAFATEFFEDDATLTLTFCLEDGPKRYSKWNVFDVFAGGWVIFMALYLKCLNVAPHNMLVMHP